MPQKTDVHLSVHTCLSVCVRACVCAHVCVRACVCACVCVHACVPPRVPVMIALYPCLYFRPHCCLRIVWNLTLRSVCTYKNLCVLNRLFFFQNNSTIYFNKWNLYMFFFFFFYSCWDTSFIPGGHRKRYST